ncbi:MAG: non-heme chloroperoxidase [Frankiales bacterium]|jgi:pimeloyl-ACP methyl ester carboxylesterase|nr:non-heme chloroperoxidase [Frankiales bacterium]
MAEKAPQIPAHTKEDIKQVNTSNRTPVVFIHGLWLLPSSWDRWAEVFDEAGFAPITPGWPDDPETVEEANARPEVFANKTVGQVADHYCAVINKLKVKPAVIGHSFGGLLAQMVAGRGSSAATVAIDAAPFRGVLPLPISALRSAKPVLENPANRHRAVPLTYEQFRYGFANAVSEDEAKELYETYAVPASGAPLFQAAAANLNPWTDVKVDKESGARAVANHVRREGRHGTSGYCSRSLQEAAAQPGRDRVRRHPEPRPRPHHRQRLARGLRPVPRLHPEIRQVSSVSMPVTR